MDRLEAERNRAFAHESGDKSPHSKAVYVDARLDVARTFARRRDSGLGGTQGMREAPGLVLATDDIFRVALGLIFVAAAAIGVPHRLRADRAGGSVSRRVDPLWFWIAMGLVGPCLGLACVAFLIHPPWVEFARLPLPPALRAIGAAPAAAGLVLFAAMFRHLGLNVTSTSMPRANATLITTGPYRWIRHPMYSAALLLVIAAALFTANALVLAGGVAMFALLAARSRLEEARLVEKFGEDYLRYRRRTGRFLPRRGTNRG